MPAIQLRFPKEDAHSHFDVVDFSGLDGRVKRSASMTPNSLTCRTVHCELQAPDSGKTIWAGFARFENCDSEHFKFTLLVRSNRGEDVEWAKLPIFLSVADGGYESLNDQQVGAFLDDLLQFRDVTQSILFSVGENGSATTTRCKVQMEDIAATDAILIEIEQGTFAASTSPTLLAIELFEVTHILVGFIEETEGNIAVFSLTGHIYRDQRQAGRRFLAPPLAVNVGEMIEVSDFGARMRLHPQSIANIGGSLDVTLPEIGQARFKIIHAQLLNDDRYEVGCMIESDAANSGNWVKFLLQHQYPLLRYRKPADYKDFWKMLVKTGYTTSDFLDLNSKNHPTIEAEWEQIDRSCPEHGATIVATDGTEIVGTIGVTRVGMAAWTAQVAAMSKNPIHIAQTRSIYAWRTRSILQQLHGEYHLAFFQRDKPFLDRFFRKFYVQEKEGANADLIWEEWRLFTHIVESASQRSSLTGEPCKKGPSVLFDAISDHGPHPCKPDAYVVQNIHLLKGRPFQHLCQYFSSAWLDSYPDPKLLDTIRNELGDHGVYTVRTSAAEAPNPIVSANGEMIIDDGWDVVWICHRRLLRKFLSNSLRALETMLRKYGNRSAA